MRTSWAVALSCILVASALGQSAPATYQTGSITMVKPHESASAKADDTARYDVSVKVGNTLYVVLYAPPPGMDITQYAVGKDLLVSIEGDTLTFNDVHGQKTQVPILRQETLPDPGPPAWSDLAKIDYFSTRLDRLTEILALSPDQQAKVKPILEQESGELAQVRNNAAISKKDKLERLQSVVLNSDQKMKTILSTAQWQKLQDVRKEQKQELEKFAKQP
jgi:hypothetical protein